MTTLTAPSTETCKTFRNHLTPTEVKLLIETVKSRGGWYSFRNSTLILIPDFSQINLKAQSRDEK